eukprot:3726143-Rhodomonas_salina.3
MQGGGVQENSLRQSKNGRESGRTSAPPMAMTDDSQVGSIGCLALRCIKFVLRWGWWEKEGVCKHCRSADNRIRRLPGCQRQHPNP